jgi:tetratricopeptide (TPR) repeat protein
MSPKQLVVVLTLALGLPAWATEQSAEDLLGRTVFQVLIGEFALRQGAVELSLDAWSDLAERTRDPRAISRAVEIAGLTGQTERAMRLVQLWLAIEPDAPQARQAHVALLIQSRQIDQLAPQIAALLASDQANLTNNLLHLNRMLARITDKPAVLQLLIELAADYPDVAEAHFAVAQAALAAGDEVRAIDATTRAITLRPSWEMAAIAHAKLIGRKNAAAGIEELSSFVRQNRDARNARLALAQMLIVEKRFPAARQQYEILLKESPDDPEIIYPAAILALQSGEHTTGRQLLERLLTTGFPDKSSIHYFLGQIAQEAGETDKAMEHFGQVSAGERYIAARTRVALLLLSQGKTDAALQQLRNTRGASPAERTQLALAEAQLLRESGDQSGAYSAVEKALRSAPDDPELLYDAALTAERIGKHQVMEAHLRHLLTRHPEHAHALNALGYSLAERNIRLEEAAQLLDKAITLAPNDAYIMDSLGWLQYRQGRLPEALTTLENAYRIKADPEIASHLAEVLWMLERRDEARRVLLEARKRNPDSAVLNAAIEKFQP